MLIDLTYFIREINIGQRSQPEVQENLNYFIQRYEREFLDMSLGSDLANEVVLASDDLENASDAMKKLILGDGTWLGLVNDVKISPIANYVYWHYVESEVLQSVGTGIIVPQNENSRIANPTLKLVRAWNDMVLMCVKMHRFITSSMEYPNYKWMDYGNLCFSGSCKSCDPCKKPYVFQIKNTLGL